MRDDVKMTLIESENAAIWRKETDECFSDLNQSGVYVCLIYVCFAAVQYDSPG